MKNNKKMKEIVLLLLITFSTFTIFNVSAEVTNVTEGSGVKANTTVVDHYTDVDAEDDINLEKDNIISVLGIAATIVINNKKKRKN